MNLQSHEKAAGVLDTPPTAYNSIHIEILDAQGLGRNEFDLLRARFASKGYTMQRVYLVGNDRPSYHVTRTAHTRIFRSCQDLRSFLAEKEVLHGL